MSEENQPAPQLPNYPPVKGHNFAERSQVKPLFKLANKMLKMPKLSNKKVLQRRNRVTKKKFKII